MAIARRLDGLSFFTKSNFKTTLLFEGVDMSGVGGKFSFALAPQGIPVLTASVSTIYVTHDEDGVPMSMVQIFAPLSAVQAAKSLIAAQDPGRDVPLYYEYRTDRLPGEAGAPAETTLIYGLGSMKGSI